MESDMSTCRAGRAQPDQRGTAPWRQADSTQRHGTHGKEAAGPAS